MDLKIPAHVPEQYATDTRREFNPETETHHFAMLVKVVDPGCTLELQIEEITGRVTRLTSTEDSATDREEFRAAALAAFDRVMAVYGL